MTKQVQFRRGSAIEHSTFVGAEGEVTVDTTNNRLVVHDGITAGGYPGMTGAPSVKNIQNIKYDSDGNIMSYDMNDSTINVTYLNKKIVSMSDGNNVTTITYDSQNRVSSITAG